MYYEKCLLGGGEMSFGETRWRETVTVPVNMHIKTNHSTENKVDDLIDAFKNMYLHVCLYVHTELVYALFLYIFTERLAFGSY